MNYLKDAVRLGLAGLGSAGAIIATSNWMERVLIFAIIILVLVTSFLLDSKDPRTHARAMKILSVEKKMLGIVEQVEPQSTPLIQAGQDAGIKLEDLVAATKDGVAADAVAAPNGVPPEQTVTQ